MPRRKSAAPVPDATDAREALLERSIAHVAKHGFADGTLRAIAAALGTSHRMLIYHFGSADSYWAEVLAGLRRREQTELRESARDEVPTVEEIWANLSAPRSLPRMRLLFEMYGRALAEPERHRAFLSEVVNDWLDPMSTAIARQLELPRSQARVQARLRLAVVRGLVLDLLTTGDRAGTSAALRLFEAALASPKRIRKKRSKS